MKAFHVVHPGIFTTLQDPGRPGYMKYGTPASGAADGFAAFAANLLVGNSAAAAVLETALFRLELEALHDLTIAVTGGDLAPKVDGEPLPMWQSFLLRKGSRLLFSARKRGFRSYLAVQGGFLGPRFLNSRSTYMRGLMGEALKRGDLLEAGEERGIDLPGRRLPPELVPDPAAGGRLRVVLGPQEDRFTERGMECFLNSSYRVSSQADRMGYRLQGSRIEHVAGADIISEPIARGAIQVPGDGLPIILLWDGQVSGGYTKIAGIISAEIDRLAQVLPGDEVRFQAVTLAEAHQALLLEKARWEKARETVAGQG